MCAYVCVRSITVLVSELMGHSEGQRESRVLTDAAAAVGLTHAGNVRQAQGLAGHVDGGTDVLSALRSDNSMVRYRLECVNASRCTTDKRKLFFKGRTFYLVFDNRSFNHLSF